MPGSRSVRAVWGCRTAGRQRRSSRGRRAHGRSAGLPRRVRAPGAGRCLNPACSGKGDPGWLVVPERLFEQLKAIKLLLDDFSPTLEQLAFALLIERGHYQRQIRKMRAVYRARRDLLIAALREHLPQLPVSGVAAG